MSCWDFGAAQTLCKIICAAPLPIPACIAFIQQQQINVVRCCCCLPECTRVCVQEDAAESLLESLRKAEPSELGAQASAIHDVLSLKVCSAGVTLPWLRLHMPT